MSADTNDHASTTDTPVLTVVTPPPAETVAYPNGIPYQDLGWTREEFDQAVAAMSHLESVWDHDELDVYDDLIRPK